MTRTEADKVSIELFHKAIALGFNPDEAQMILNTAHDIALNGEQTEIQLLSQFY